MNVIIIVGVASYTVGFCLGFVAAALAKAAGRKPPVPEPGKDVQG